MNKSCIHRSSVAGLVLLAGVFIAPIWLFRYFPSQDGPCHLYNAQVITLLLSGAPSRLQEYFALNISFIPNLLSHPTLAALMTVSPPLIAEKLLLSVIVLLMPLSLYYFLVSVNRNAAFYSVLGFLFAYHYLLQMGFYNFSLSVPLFFFATGYYVRHRKHFDLSKVTRLYILSVLTYCAHFQTFCLLLGTLTFLMLVHHRVRFFAAVKSAGRLLPLYLLMGSYLFFGIGGQVVTRWSSGRLAEYFFTMRSLVCFTDLHVYINVTLLVLMTALAGESIYTYMRSGTVRSFRTAFLLLAAAFSGLYFIAPWSIGTGSYINDRIQLMIIPVALPFLRGDYSVKIRRLLVCIFLVLALVHLGINSFYYYHFNKGLKEFTSGADMVEDNSSILALSSDWWTYNGLSGNNIEPFVQAVNYYCLDNGCVNLTNYEARMGYFPVLWKKRHTGPVDYILTWKLDPSNPMAGDTIQETHGILLSEIVARLSEDYMLIYSTGNNLRLYCHKSIRSGE